MTDLSRLTAIGEAIARGLGASVLAQGIADGELNVTVEAQDILRVATYLRDTPDLKFISIIDVTAVDWLSRDPRFDVVYHLLSPTQNARLRLRAPIAEDVAIASLISVFPGVDWFEREVFDLYGVPFTGHPDLRRLLTDYGFEGHPLRKDFPTTGYVEVRYDDEKKKVVYDPVKLTQEMRRFDFLSPWEGADYPILPGDEKAGSKP